MMRCCRNMKTAEMPERDREIWEQLAELRVHMEHVREDLQFYKKIAVGALISVLLLLIKTLIQYFEKGGV